MHVVPWKDIFKIFTSVFLEFFGRDDSSMQQVISFQSDSTTTHTSVVSVAIMLTFNEAFFHVTEEYLSGVNNESK